MKRKIIFQRLKKKNRKKKKKKEGDLEMNEHLNSNNFFINFSRINSGYICS